MSWLKSKSYSLKVRKDKASGERMDTILKGVIASEHSDNVKKDLLVKIAAQGAQNQNSGTVLSVLDVTAKWYLEGSTFLQQHYGLEIYRSWSKHNLTTFEQFFNKEFLIVLLSKRFPNEANVGILLSESMRILQLTPLFRNHCTIVETKAISYIREHPFVECLTNFSDFVLEFKECIPKGDSTLQFCTNLIRSLSLCSPPDNENEIVKFVKSVNRVANLLSHIWSNTDSATVLASLKEIFTIISMPCDIEPSMCLGSLVPYLPLNLIKTVVKNAIHDSSIDNNSMVTALQRIIDWLLWPTTQYVDTWVIEFLKGLASVQKYSILITVTENKVDQIFQKLQFVPVREPGLNIVSHMLLSFQHSPDPFHKILPMVPKIVATWKEDGSEQSCKLLTRLTDLLHILMYLHAGFPELYDPVYEIIKDYPKPSPDVIKFRLLESKWTAHRDGSAYVPRSYQPKAEMGKTGLFNLGNTCYMNSIIQSLYMCTSFQDGVLQHSPSLEQNMVVKLQYVFAFLKLSQRPAYAPVNFLSSSRPPWFTPGFQQDCSEFLKYLLDQLHEQETNFLSKANEAPTSPSKTKSKKVNNGKKEEGPKRTLIEQNFGGKMTTTIKCLNCGKESKKEEMFMDLPLAFPEYNASYVGQKSLAGGDSKMSSSAPHSSQSRTVQNTPPTLSPPPPSNGEEKSTNCLHLNDLVKHYLKTEKLVDDNKYHCDHCGGLQEGERQIKVVESPEYLILTLLRFSYDARLQARSKIFREVKYPKTLLLPVEDEGNKKDCGISTSPTSSRQRRDSFRSAVAGHLENCGVDMGVDCVDVYSLCSVVIHSGTSSDCGHYYCYGRHTDTATPETAKDSMSNPSTEDDVDFLQDKWYLFNDSRVSYASYSSFCNVSQRFTKDTAYVLIYKKVKEETILGSPTTTLPMKSKSGSPKSDTLALRADLRAAVVKDNKIYLQEQESTAAKKASRKRANDSQWYNWKDDDNNGGSGPCGGGGGSLGDLDTSGSRFVF